MTPSRQQMVDALASLRDSALRYAAVRFTATQRQHVRVRNDEVDTLVSTIDRAIGVERVPESLRVPELLGPFAG